MKPLSIGGDLGAGNWDIAAVVVLSAVAGAVLCGLALVAYRQRGTRAYLLIVLALTALFARPLIALLSGFAVVSEPTHHFIEHALDTLFVVLVLGAVYYARTVEKRLNKEGL
ncbi:hypothetical protein Har1130_10315 [Haloarcula sp. CBA1130]|uniref:DUF7471 family protein n=1 Tax=unclassified Haloarcula TaxID=2624677 RepID=UPI001245E83F|nr:MULTISPECIES: hypothetical protein [unclassified Haloarcula]KAA9400046.1 hypothetical protein Har1129_10410 [Haloarcula sp. CBA1129]KAA9403120.1 hypothetical protein Har1130_10315 [Haloarcula sp. CBA1130]